MPTPDGHLTFAELCDFVGASRSTVRTIVRDKLKLRPTRLGPVTLYSPEQAEAARDYYRAHGGRWPREPLLGRAGH